MKKESINLTLLDGPESTILLPTIENWNLEYSSRDTTFENDADMYLALWLKYTETYENPFFINTKPVLFGGVEVWDFVHRWESSLVWAGRPAADIFDQKDIQISDSTTGRLVVYQMPNTEKTDAVLYWIKEIPFINNHNVERKYVHLVVWSNTDYLKSINLIEKADDTQSIEKLFLSLAIPMDSYWSKEGITLITNSENNLELVGLSSDDNYNDNDNHNKQSSNHIQHNSESKIIQDEDDSPDKLIVKANLFVTEYNFIQALELYDTVLKENPENTFAMIGKANTLLTMRDMKTAIDQYDDVLEIDPNHTNALNGKANALLQSEKPEFAINLYDQTLKIDSQNTNAMIGKSLAFIALGEQQQALSLLDMVLKVNPDNLHAKELKANMDNNNSSHDIAFSTKNKLHVILFSFVLFLLAYVTVSLIDYTTENNLREWYLKAEKIFTQKDYHTALQLYEKILDVNPNYADALGGKAAVYHKTGSYAVSLEYYDKALFLESGNLYFLGDKANLLVAMGRFDEAKTEFDNVLKVKPFHLGALNGMGNMYHILQNYQKELYYRDQVLRADFNNTDALVGKGNAYAGLKNYDSALEYYDKSLAKIPDHINALNGKGNMYYALKQNDEAIRWYDKSLEIDPKNINALNGKNIVLDKIKQEQQTDKTLISLQKIHSEISNSPNELE